MGTLRITEAELARDVHVVLSRVQEGMEVIVEQDHRPVAVIRAPQREGRLLSESIALAESRGTTAIPAMRGSRATSKKGSRSAASH